VFLLVPGLVPKLVVLPLLGILAAPAYPLLQARLYAALPGRSGTANTLASGASLVRSLFPGALGFAAERFGLASAMWFLVLGPLSIFLLLPRASVRE
jgi:MFS transporter, FSR family, fosmidomycin resistance protein